MAPRVKNTDDYAVVVGIDEYPGYRSLKGAVADATDFATWLCEEEHGGAVPKENCKTVYSVKEPLAPLQEQIDVAFDSVFSAIPLGRQARRLYVYFSGHGMAESNLITDLCLASWAKKFPNRALDAQQYLDIMMKLGKFQEIIMLLDCCRVRIVSAKGVIPGFTAAAPGPASPKARYFLANATEFLNASYEAATGDPTKAADPIIRGYFTRALMTALRGAAASDKGGVPASKLKNYLEENVSLLAKRDGWTQDSEVVNGLKGDPIFGSASPPEGPPPPPFMPPPPPAGAELPGGPLPGSGPRGMPKLLPLTLLDDLGAQTLMLRDSKKKTLFRGRIATTRKFKLPPGPYTLHTKYKNTTFQTAISLEGPLTISTSAQFSPAPELYSAAPLETSPTSHEYYTKPSERWSRRPTRAPFPNADSSLLVFVRAVDESKHDASNLAQGLVLLNQDGEQISRFASVETQRNERFGWLALHMGISRGTYFLRFEGHAGEHRDLPPRELPLQLCAGWQTQVFLFHREAPLLQTAKIFFARGNSGFRPQSRETEAADIALNGLQNNRDLLTEGALNLLLHAKFENPMLGLVGAHVLIQRQRALQARLALDGRRASSKEVKERAERRRLIAIVLRNLNYLLPNSPDVAALNLLAGFKERANIRIAEPPMLRPGLLALMNEAASRPEVLATESRLPQIAPHIYADSPWSTWAPVASQGAMNWVHFALLDYMRTDHTRLTKGKILETLAVKLGIPQQTIRLAAKDFATTPAPKLWRSLPREYRDLFESSDSTESRAANISAHGLIARTVELSSEV